MGAHMGGALQDRFLQRAHRAGVNIFRRKRGLGLRGFSDRFVEVALVRLNPIEDAGFIEINMRLDEAGRNQPPAEIDGLAVRRESTSDCGDLPVAIPMSVSSCSAPIRRALLRMSSIVSSYHVFT